MNKIARYLLRNIFYNIFLNKYLPLRQDIDRMAKAPDRGSFPLDHFHECDD